MQLSRTLIEGSLSRGLVLFALPILCGNVLQTVNGSINSVWVGQYLGEASLAATSNANSVMFLLLGGVFGLSMAATILVGQNIGAGQVFEAKRVVGTSATFFAVLSVAMSAAGWLESPRLLAAMSTPAASIPLATAYMRVIFLALPFMYMYAFVMAVLRGAGDSKTPFYFLVLSVGLDIALNPLFIFGLGPIPALGIAGSALATFVAQAVSLIALIASLYRRKNGSGPLDAAGLANLGERDHARRAGHPGFLGDNARRLGGVARPGRAALDRRGKAAADRAALPLLYDLGDHPALRQCGA